MNIMNYLTRKHMTSNKKRTIITIIGVIISVAMITAVSTAAETFMDFLQRIQMQNSGEWHVRYYDITKDQADQIVKDQDDQFHFYTNGLGYTKIDASKNTKKPYINIVAYDEKAYEKMPVDLIDGRFPEKENEIVVTRELQSATNKGFTIGDTISASFGKRYGYIEGEYTELKEDIEYLGEYIEGKEGEQLVDCKDKEDYVIVGIVENPRGYYSVNYNAFGYCDYKKLKDNDTITLNVFLNKVDNDIYQNCNNLANKYGIDTSNIEFNDSLLRFYGVSRYTDTFNLMIKMFSIILIVIIMVGSIALIYNSFAISINERSKQFGMLASVGATKEQKRNAVLYEGATIGLISIPLGILAGFFGMWVTFKVVSPMLMTAMSLDIPLHLIVSFKAIIVAIIFSIITIFLSAYLPARKAAKITPIEALRQSKNIKVKAKHVKTSKLTRKLLGIEGDFAVKNLKRNRKHYRALVFSLMISLILFISVGSYVYYLKQSLNSVYGGSNYDVAVWNVDFNEKEMIEDCISQIDGVSDGKLVSTLYNKYTLTEDDTNKIITEDCVEAIKKVPWAEKEHFVFNSYISFVDDKIYEKLSGKAIDKNDTERFHAVLINHQVMKLGYSLTEVKPTTLSSGDILNLIIQKKYVNDEKSPKLKDSIQITIDNVTDDKERPLGVNRSIVGGGLTLIMPYSSVGSITTDDTILDTGYYFNTNNPLNIEKNVDTVLIGASIKSSFSIYNQAGELIQNKQIMLAFSVFAYGFIILISLICIANLCNTISTSFSLRRREFAMIKSVGMTPEAFHKMIMIESVMYGVKACLYGLPISIVMTLWIKKSVSYNFTRYFVFPYQTYAIGIVAVFLVVGVAMLYSSRKVRKENIIEGLKTELN